VPARDAEIVVNDKMIVNNFVESGMASTAPRDDRGSTPPHCAT
jgi:hypothetical protein